MWRYFLYIVAPPLYRQCGTREARDTGGKEVFMLEACSLSLGNLEPYFFMSYVAVSSSSSGSGRLPGHGSMVTAMPMPLRPIGMLVTHVHSFLSGQ